MLLAAQERSGKDFIAEAFSNSPPYWMPQEMHLKYEEYASLFEKGFNPDALDDEVDWSSLPVEKTAIADYVWLSLRFDG